MNPQPDSIKQQLWSSVNQVNPGSEFSYFLDVPGPDK